MNVSGSPALARVLRFIVAHRRVVVGIYALLVPLAIVLATRIDSDSSIDRLIVQGDADFRDQQEFRRIFPEREQVVLLAEAPDLFAPAVLARVAEIERRLNDVAGVRAFSAVTLFERTHPGQQDAAGRAEEFRRFVEGSDLFRRQGLVGPGFLGLPLDLDVHGAAERDATLGAIDRALAPFEIDPQPLTRIGRVGDPYVDAYLEVETGRASLRAFPLFGLFVVVIILTLYRSVRTLAAFLLTLAASVALTVGFGHAAGFAFTIVSSLVPLTILITCTASLVYIQSRFVEMPEGRSIEEHQVFALSNKFTATTASMFAAAIGFAALAVSKIRPIREMGMWVAAGLILTWVVVFTLFPALQRMCATPVLGERTATGRRLLRVLDALPRWSYRWRRVLLPLTALSMLAGVAALLGVPGHVAPMALETDGLDYIDQSLPIARDTRRFEQAISGLSVVQIWVSAPAGRVLSPEILRGLEMFARDLERDPRVGSVTGPTSMLRWMSLVGGGGDRLPDDPAAWPGLAARLEQLLMQEEALRDYVDVGSLSEARLTVVHRGKGFAGVEDLKGFFGEAWERAAAADGALRDCRMRVVGQGLLQAKIAQYLVPTLTESFVLTAVIIFLAFLVVFRSGAARLMAMIPSVFAILTMFVVMRLVGIPLNVATILIASTVLGASENDQIHFFFHFQEGRDGAGTEEALRHALHVAGRAILFATLINAGGFLALAMSGLPPMRQFGIISASAFVLSMLSSLTALPAALWVFSRQKPGDPPQRVQ
jgi:predicted RND superfamily exporter protein